MRMPKIGGGEPKLACNKLEDGKRQCAVINSKGEITAKATFSVGEGRKIIAEDFEGTPQDLRMLYKFVREEGELKVKTTSIRRYPSSLQNTEI